MDCVVSGISTSSTTNHLSVIDSQTATNLRAFRTLFPPSKKKDQVVSPTLTNGLITSDAVNNRAFKRLDDDDDDGDFVGFDENDPLRLRLMHKLKVNKDFREKFLHLNNDTWERKNSRLENSSEIKPSETTLPLDSVDVDAATSHSDSEGSSVKKQMKRLLPNDEQNFIKVKGARVKQVSLTAGYVKRLPVATFGNSEKRTNSVAKKSKLRFLQPPNEPQLPVNESGCVRTEGFKTRKPFDMFGWLASRQRTMSTIINNPNDWGRHDLPISMLYRNLREKASNSLRVCSSAIHGRGLFTRREYVDGEIVIEYAGERIRAVLSDRREKYYESKGIGCYFFTIDEKVVIDATLKGNAARFINHSCEPNCRSKMVEILGKKHILIFAIQNIPAGQELTYDYKFASEPLDKKIACLCGAKKCRKYLN